jgi:large subunit ribosomal protein L21
MVISQNSLLFSIFGVYCSNMELAVIATGGKQYSVSKGDSIKIEKLSGTHKVGDKVIFDKVLLVDDGKNTTIGTPYIAKASVEGVISEIGRAPKIDVIHYKQKSRYYKKNGHRQPFFKIKIENLK